MKIDTRLLYVIVRVQMADVTAYVRLYTVLLFVYDFFLTFVFVLSSASIEQMYKRVHGRTVVMRCSFITANWPDIKVTPGA